MDKTFAVDPSAAKPTVSVRTGDTTETFTFKTKGQADKKIMKLLAEGYKFDNQAPKIAN